MFAIEAHEEREAGVVGGVVVAGKPPRLAFGVMDVVVINEGTREMFSVCLGRDHVTRPRSANVFVRAAQLAHERRELAGTVVPNDHHVLVDLFLGARNVRSRPGNGSCFLFARLGGALIHQWRGVEKVEVRVEAKAAITLLPRSLAKNA